MTPFQPIVTEKLTELFPLAPEDQAHKNMYENSSQLLTYNYPLQLYYVQ